MESPKQNPDRKMKLLALFTFLVMVLMMIGGSAGLTCFHCPAGCEIKNMTPILDCPKNESLGKPVCVKTTVHGKVVGLACSFTNSTPLGLRGHEYVCNVDYCNGSDGLIPSWILSIGLVIMAFVAFL